MIVEMALEVVDLSAEVKSICEKLGLDAKRVRRLEITPKDALAEVFIPDEEGRLKLVEGRVPTGEVWTRVKT